MKNLFNGSAVFFGWVLAAGPVCAGSILVTTNADGPLGSITDECTLRAAVATAATESTGVDGCSGSGGIISFDESLINSTITLTAGQMEISGAGPTGNFGIIGPSDDPAGITIDAGNNSRIFHIEGSEPSDFYVFLQELTLTGGRTADFFARGGAIFIQNADLRLTRTLITGNSTAGEQSKGGALFIGGGNLNLEDSTLSNNSTEGELAEGGALFAAGANVTISRSTILDNSTMGAQSEGGGLAVTNSFTSLIGSSVSDNSTAGDFAGGGGVYVLNGEFRSATSTIAGNSTAGEGSAGGGLFAHPSLNGSLDVTLVNSTVSGNSISGNQSDGGGLLIGGVSGLGKSSTATLTHSTVAFNTAADGTGGISASAGGVGVGPAVLVLNNTLVVQAEAGETACNRNADQSSSTLATDDSCTGTMTGAGDIVLAALADNGGFTQTHALNAGSVAIGAAGDCVKLFGINRDQRGEPRPGGGSETCDIGAYEFQGKEEDEVFHDRFQQ